MAKTNPVRVGFIGAGDICRVRHLPGLADLDDVEVISVCNRSRSSAQKVANDFGIRAIDEDWRQLIERDDLDAVFVGTWPYMHKEMAIATLEAGKHCFCQARMAMDLEQAKQMLDAAQSHPDLVNMICPPPTRMPFEPYIRQVLESEQLGQLTLVQLSSVNGANLKTDRVHWRERIEFSGLQTMALGIFAETLHAFVGQYDQLSAQMAIPIGTKTDETNSQVSIEIPQVVTVTGSLESGALATEHHLGVATDSSTPHSCLTIWGLRGSLRFQFGDQIEVAAAGEPLRAVEVPQDLQRPWSVERDFIEAVRAARAGQPWSVSPDFAEAVQYMRKVEAVHQSAKTGQAVSPQAL